MCFLLLSGHLEKFPFGPKTRKTDRTSYDILHVLGTTESFILIQYWPLGTGRSTGQRISHVQPGPELENPPLWSAGDERVAQGVAGGVRGDSAGQEMNRTCATLAPDIKFSV